MGDVTCMGILCAIWQCLRPTVESTVTRWLQNQSNMSDLDAGRRELKGLESHLVETLKNLGVPGETFVPTPLVIEWQRGVAALDRDVDQFRSTTSTSRCCYCGCLCSSCELDELLRRVGDLKAKKETLGVVLVRPAPVVEIRGASLDPSTFASQVEEILQHLENPEVITVGIYGMCGVGKTELLKAVNNHLFRKSREEPPNLPFDVVFHVDLKQEGQNQRDTIQTGIRRRLGLPSTASLEDTLSPAKRCLLLLDHVWNALDWEEIGIPHPSPSLKVVFATLSKSSLNVVFATRPKSEWHDAKKAQRSVRVDYLSEDASWLLFCRKMEEENREAWGRCSSYVQGLAKKVVVSMCGGLPGAIIPMARGVPNFTTAEAWEGIEKQLKHSPHQVRGMMDLLSTLKRSYDGLKTDSKTMAECLLYCCLFPESRSISKEQLIDYWIGEGFLEEGNVATKIGNVRDVGSRVIEGLQEACFLERGNWDQREVNIHSVVRRMALWLTHGDTNKFLTSARLESFDVSCDENWQGTMRLSLMDCHDKEVPENVIWCFPKLLTLLLINHDVELYNRSSRCTVSRFSDRLFHFPALGVLDLSGTEITSLPDSISSLVELKYLNLSHTDITSLPLELKELKELRLLILRYTTSLLCIPEGAISKFTKLQRLDFYCSCYGWTWEDRDHEVRTGNQIYHLKQASLIHLLRVTYPLEELGITIKTSVDLDGLLVGVVTSRESLSPKPLLKSTTFLSLDGVRGLTEEQINLVFTKMEKLLELSISGCSDLVMLRFRLKDLKGLKVLSLRDLPALSMIEADRQHVNEYPLEHLHTLQIRSCNKLKHLTCVKEFPYLQEITLASCDMVQKLIQGPFAWDGTSLSELRKISLVELKSFSRFSCHPLLLPNIQHITVSKTSNLKKLPLGRDNLKTMKEICGEQEWWDGLKWYAGGNSDFRHCFRALNN